MTSLADVYEGLGAEATQRQLYAGTGLFVVGASLLVAGIVVATTGVLSPLGFNAWQSWEPAGILAGLGLPAVFLGIFTVLPASREVRAAAVIGASVAVLGVTLFAHAYPYRWIGNSPNLTPLVTLVYFLGAITTFWCLFTAVATFQSRNDPGGTVRLEVTRAGETRVVEVDRADLPGALDGTVADGGSAMAQPGGPAGVTLLDDANGTPGTTDPATSPTTTGPATGASTGPTTTGPATAGRGTAADATGSETDDSDWFGGSDAGGHSGGSWGLASPDDDGPSVGSEFVDAGPEGTEVDRDDDPADDGIAERSAGAGRSATDGPGEGSSRRSAADAGPGANPTPASDGGATSPGIRTPADDAEVLDSRADPADTTDSYCGNCKHFRYVQTSRGIRPFCELDDGIMDDVEACDRWEPNRLD